MKVYSHYYRTDGQHGLRWRTLLKFGNSWNIIGSVVMKNPGSSVPICPVDDKEVVTELSRFEESDDVWFEFTDDDTMRKVSVLFASYYGKEYVSQLNGVVQIFNLFYIMEPNEILAEEKLKKAGLPADFKNTADLLEYDLNKLVAPVYLGFGNLAFKKEFRDSAKRYYDRLFELGFPTEYLKEKYEDNKFYHPQSLCGTGCNYPESLFIRNKFKETPIETQCIHPLPKLKMPKEEQLKLIKCVIDHHADFGLKPYNQNVKDYKTIRFELPLDLQITITATGKGYVGIRHVDNHRLKNYCVEKFALKDVLETLLYKYNFYRNDSYKMWLAVTDLELFPTYTTLMDQIKNLHDELLTLSKNVNRY